MPKIKVSSQIEKEIIKKYKNGELIKNLAVSLRCHHMTIIKKRRRK